jgi:hypothetical protein
MDIMPSYEVYIDESNSPAFQSKPGLNSPYVVCAIAIPVVEKKRIEIFLPHDEQGHPIKASSPHMTDHLAAQFIGEILKFDVLFSLVGLDSTDEENCNIADTLTKRANNNRRKRIKKSNLMYARVAAQAIINIWGSNRLSFFDIVFDSNSVPDREFGLFENILKNNFGRRGVRIRNISRQTEQQAPLLFAADIIAGIGKRQSSHQDVPESWNKVIEGQQFGKVFIENGIEVYHAS